MTAYDSMLFDDLRERISQGEELSAQDQARYNRLDKAARVEWENTPESHWHGGHPDMF